MLYCPSALSPDAVCLNGLLDNVSLVTTKRKPFDVLAEGPLSEKSRSNWTRLKLFAAGAAGFPQPVAEALLAA